MRKLHAFHVDTHLLTMFYSSVMCSVLAFGIPSWGGNISKFDKNRLDRVVKKSSRLIGKTQDSYDTLYDSRITKKLTDITEDATHPLHNDIDCLKIVRSGRFRIPRAHTNRYLKSFVPSAVRAFNKSVGRRA